jgi:hypothetical protein
VSSEGWLAIQLLDAVGCHRHLLAWQQRGCWNITSNAVVEQEEIGGDAGQLCGDIAGGSITLKPLICPGPS